MNDQKLTCERCGRSDNQSWLVDYTPDPDEPGTLMVLHAWCVAAEVAELDELREQRERLLK